jgi:hypothetical protein
MKRAHKGAPVWRDESLAATHSIDDIKKECAALKIIAIADWRIGIAENFTAINYRRFLVEDVANSSANGPGVGVVKQRCAV